jgi:hypothetical protein
MSAIAKWCQGERRTAVEELLAGLKAEYSSSSDPGHPLLFFFVGVREPALFPQGEAVALAF